MPSDTFKNTIKWYDTHASDCSIAWDDHFAPEQLGTFMSMLPEYARVLDAGCGTGRYTCLLQDAGLNVTGIDISPGMLEIAEEKHPELHFMEGDFLQLEFADRSFDGVWAHNSIVHFDQDDDIKTALSEFRRILKTGGILHLLVTASNGDQKSAVIKDKLHPEGVYYRLFSKQEVHSLLDYIGYKVLVLEAVR